MSPATLKKKERVMTHIEERQAFTTDRGPPGTTEVFTIGQIGPKRKLLPNGSLLCEDVPIARLGWMVYGEGEVPLKADPSTRRIYVERTADELFRPETIGSFIGAPVTDGHPMEGNRLVTPDNWKRLAGGFAVDVRQGEGDLADCIVADLIISDANLIADIQAGKREVSCGYGAGYDQTVIGEGRQKNIIGNHIALVERGRCGPRCAIGDHAPPLGTKGTSMPQANSAAAPKKRRIISAEALATLRTQLDGLDAMLEEDESGDGTNVHVHVHSGAATVDDKGKGGSDDPTAARFERLEGAVSELANTVKGIGDSITAFMTDTKNRSTTGDGAGGAGSADDPTKSGDSKALETSWGDLQAGCEILVPGFKMPTFDSAQPRVATIDRMCQQRRRALGLFGATTDGASIIASIDKDADVDTADCKDVAMLFKGAVAMKAQANNHAATRGSGNLGRRTDAAPAHTSVSQTVAKMNEANKEFWNRSASTGGAAQASAKS